MKWLSNLLRGGVKIGYSDGKMFDPHYQERTDAIKDIDKKDKAKRKKKLDEMFNLEEEK